MHTTFRLSVFLLFIVQLFLCCTSDSLPEPGQYAARRLPAPDAYQDKIRTQPYPKADNELYLNPAPLVVPQAMKTGERLQFSFHVLKISEVPKLLLSAPQEWCMRRISSSFGGRYCRYWRFCSTNLNGTTLGEWSAIYRLK